MTRHILILFTLISLLSCNSKNTTAKPEKQETEEEKLQTKYDLAERILKFENEKIQLLSIVKNINSDTLYLVLKEYIAHSEYEEDSKNTYAKLIAELSTKFEINKPRIASIIFSFKYEMLTRDEIEQAAIEEAQENIQDQYEYEEIL